MSRDVKTPKVQQRKYHGRRVGGDDDDDDDAAVSGYTATEILYAAADLKNEDAKGRGGGRRKKRHRAE